MKGCLICGGRALEKELFCNECVNFALVLERKCPRCGAFTLDPSKPDCNSCRGKKLYFDCLYSHYIYCGSVKKVISSMKYGKIQSFAEVLGKFLSTQIPENIVQERTVVFPPMTFFNKLIRSFNQAEILGHRIATVHKLTLDINVVKKTRKTKPQASLTYGLRQENLKNAFSLQRSVKNEKFLIVDDVCTTFSTINTISELLKKNGAESVNAATIARTSPYFS